MVKKC